MPPKPHKTGLSDVLSGFFEPEPPALEKQDGDGKPQEEGPKTAGMAVPVLVPVPAERPYTYVLREGCSASAGSIVRVPLGPRTVIGMVADGEPDGGIDAKKLRAIVKVCDVPPIHADIRRFVAWVARYTMASPGLVARMVVQACADGAPENPASGVRASGRPLMRETPARFKAMEIAKDGQTWLKADLARIAGVTPGVIDGLLKAGALEPALLPPRPVAQPLDPGHGPAALFEDQEAAAELLRDAVRKGGYSTVLIDGVTGSGKTEVYFEAVAQALKAGKQVLILVPEISLTAAFLDRFAARFAGRPAEWHSDMPPRQRERIWRAVAEGEVRVVVGARSALFLPYRELGLIVVDEEHDAAYKQEDRVIYHARDMAVVRGHLGDFPVMLASATPSLETFVNAEEGRYARAVLPGRIAAAVLPDIAAIDMRTNGPEKGRWLAPRLVDAIGTALAEKRQSLLFLNRRGYAPLTLCRQCGFRFQCPDCSAWLVEHRFRNSIECHHCGHRRGKPDRCPNCDGENTLTACGPGVERIHEETLERFPQARSVILSSDMFSTVKRLKQELAAIERGEADIVIGTQLVAKGHNFPKLALVGVVDADLGLAHGDMRAAERTFQILAQVTGRAGRAGGKSLALMQTYAPDHPVMKAILSGDRDAFYRTQAAERKEAGLPPYGRLVSFIVSGNDMASAMKYARHLRAHAPAHPRIMVLGPSEAPLAVLRERHRVRLLIQAPKSIDIQAYIRDWLTACAPARGGVQMQIDVDPQSFW